MSRWTLDGNSRNALLDNPFAVGLVQPACDTCGGEDPSASLESRYPLPNPVANTPLAQGFLELNTSLDQALFDADTKFNPDTNEGRPGVLVLGAGPTSAKDINSSVMHELQIASILKDMVGVNPNDIHVGFVRELPNESSQQSASEFIEDSPDAFEKEVVTAFCREFNNTTLALSKAQANIANDPNLQRIGQINMSFTMSPKIGADVLFERLEYRDEETGKRVFTQLGRDVYGLIPSSKASKRYQKALTYVQKIVSRSPEIQNARKAYIDQVWSLKNQGVRCIVATGNENVGNHGADVSDGEAFNLFCTPDTINVAAAKADGKVASFSSRSGKHNDTTPTVMALGQEVPVAFQWDKLDGQEDGLINGTSFAAPQVAGLLSQLNQYNDLSAAEEDAWLKTLKKEDVIVDTPATRNEEGLGFFNPKGFDVAA